MLALWWLGSGKLKLEGFKWVQGPSSSNSDSRPTTNTQIKVKVKQGEGSRLEKIEEEHHTKTMKAAIQDIEERYYNPDPLFRLIGESNEAEVLIDGNKKTALIDLGDQISAIAKGKAKKMKLKVQKLKKLLRIEGTGRGKVTYEGYVEVLLEVPGIQNLSEYILMLVIEDSEYGERVLLQIGTLHIDIILEKATPEELNKIRKAFKRSRVARPVHNQKGCFNLDMVKGPIKVTKEVAFGPGETVKINGLTELKGNTKRSYIVAEPMQRGRGTDLPSVIINGGMVKFMGFYVLIISLVSAFSIAIFGNVIF